MNKKGLLGMLDRPSDENQTRSSNLKLLWRCTKRNQTLETPVMQKFFVMLEGKEDGDYAPYRDFLLEENT